MKDEADHQALALERFREYLMLMARLHLAGKRGARLDPSDVVQQTLLDAHRKRAQFRGGTEAEMAGWLRQMLACRLADALRALHRDKRDVDREQSLQVALDQSSARLEAFLAAEATSPSQRVERQEQIVRLADALAELPEPQREAIVLRHCQGWPLADISRRLNRTPAAVAGLLKRGLRLLREKLQEGE
jgi:RNA polymerase sigma-70 factor (ECF subfamily)